MSEHRHHYFILLTFPQLCWVSRLCFSKRWPLVSSPPNLMTLNIIKRWLLGFQKLAKLIEREKKKKNPSCTFLPREQHAINSWQSLLNISLVIKMFQIMKTHVLRKKKKNLTDHISQRKTSATDSLMHPLGSFHPCGC